MSPIEIEVALHYHYSPLQFPFARRTPAATQAMHWFGSIGVLEKMGGTLTDPEWKSTERLDVYVEALRSVQLPVLEKRWVIPKNPSTVDASGATT